MILQREISYFCSKVFYPKDAPRGVSAFYRFVGFSGKDSFNEPVSSKMAQNPDVRKQLQI